MSDYYIKYITGPGGQMGYPENNGYLVAFAPRQEKPCNRFKECDGFLLYETGHKTGDRAGAKAIYARGVVAVDQSSFINLPEFGVGEKWPYVVKVNIQKRVDPAKGVPQKRIEEIVGKKLRDKPGGIWKITKEEFDALSSELNNARRASFWLNKIKQKIRGDMKPKKFYIGDYKEDVIKENHGGWFIGKFMEVEPRKNDEVEVKYWEFGVGNPNHDTKTSKTIECTLILEGEIEGYVDGEKVNLYGGQYIVIKPGTSNGFPKKVYKRVRGITIKAPSDPSAKKVLKSEK